MVIRIPDDLDRTFIKFIHGGLYFMTGLGTMDEEELSEDELKLARVLVDILNDPMNQTGQ